MKPARVPTAAEARSLIDAKPDDDRLSPDGIDRRAAWRIVWQAARDLRENPEPTAPVTPWMRLSEEEKDRVRARRRLRVVAPAAVEVAPVAGQEAA